MSKGYMVMVDGGATPAMVHPKHKSAFKEMHRLAKENPGKEVMVVFLTDRFVCKEGHENAKTVGTHLPPDLATPVNKRELIRGKPKPLIESIVK